MRTRCDVCGTAGRLWFRRGERELLRCTACGFAWVPQGILLTPGGVSIYEDEEGALFERQADYYYDEGAVDAAAEKLTWVSGFVKPGARILDAGANVGLFVAEARGAYDAIGIEPSPLAVRHAAERAPGAVAIGSIYDDLPAFDGRFDAITLFDVIEHLEDPRRALAQCRRYLAPGGTLFITTPDSGSLTARLLGARWHYLDLDQHVSIFGRSNLARLLSDAGFSVLSRRTLGRRYRCSYIVRRLEELGRDNATMRLAARAAAPLRLVPEWRVSINIGDVVGIAARLTREA